MATIALLVAVFTVIALFEVPKILEKGLWREFLVFSVLLLFGFTLSVLLALEVRLPSPVKGIRSLMNPILRLLGIHTHLS
ncbi:MAG: hypothetical protein GX338_05505 [Firmicutes bacterium]|nr:hypothetical protein [Bacillota bacterium]